MRRSRRPRAIVEGANATRLVLRELSPIPDATRISPADGRDRRSRLDPAGLDGAGRALEGELDRLAGLPRGADGKLPLVVLRADKALDYGRVIGLMGELNRAGITQLSLVTAAGGAPVSAGSAAKP